MGSWAWLAASVAIASVFAVAGLAKLADLRGSQKAIAEFGVAPGIAQPLGVVLPMAELAVAASLLAAGTARWGAWSALALLLTFAGAISWNLARGRAPDCHCFGQIHSTPASVGTVVRNLALAVLAAAIALGHQPPALGSWQTLALAAAVVLLAATLVARGTGGPRSTADEPGEGLAVGSPAPAFSLPALDGSTVTLDALLGRARPVVLVFTDPHCGPCLDLAPEVARWQREHSDPVTVAVVERADGQPLGRPDQHGRVHVLIQPDDEVSAAYRVNGTPGAVLVGADARIASAVAPGAAAIRRLVAGAAGVPESVSDWDPRFAPPALPRREFILRLAGAWAATTAILSWPARALGVVSCPPGQVRCAGECVNPLVDNAHCGFLPRCGTVCPPGAVCAGGRCVRSVATGCVGDSGGCRRSLHELCCGNTQLCAKVDEDPAHCGGCGRRCPPDRPKCCQGRCVDSQRDPRACGGQCRRCPTGWVCVGGTCREECPGALRRCGGTCYHPNFDECCRPQNRVVNRDCGCSCPAGRCCGGRCCKPPDVCRGGKCVCIPADLGRSDEACFFQP